MKNYVPVLAFILVCASFCACSENDNPDPDPVEPLSPNFISFKYKGTAYEMRGDSLCLFSRYGDDSYTITGNDPVAKNAFTISAEQKLEQGGKYNIYPSSPYLTPVIHLLFSAGGTITEQNFHVESLSAVEIIGQLAITEMTNDRLSGTFTCKMTGGDISEGKFSVKEKVYK